MKHRLFVDGDGEGFGLAAPRGVELLGQGGALPLGARPFTTRRRELLFELDDLGTKLARLMRQDATIGTVLA